MGFQVTLAANVYLAFLCPRDHFARLTPATSLTPKEGRRGGAVRSSREKAAEGIFPRRHSLGSLRPFLFVRELTFCSTQTQTAAAFPAAQKTTPQANPFPRAHGFLQKHETWAVQEPLRNRE